MSAPSFDVAVIGGGIVGLSCALELQERGRSVVVVDPGDARSRASFGNAGVLSRGSILPMSGPAVWRSLLRYAGGRDPGLRLSARSLPALLPWLARFLAASNAGSVRRTAASLNPLVAASFDRHLALADLVGARHLIRREGWLRLYRGRAAYLGGAVDRAILEEHGVGVQTVVGEDVYAVEPGLARRFSHGLLFPETGAVEDPGEMVRLYEAAFVARGGAFVRGAARAIEPAGRGATIRLPGRSIAAGWAVLAAGIGSARLARTFGCRVPLAAERGYHVHHRLAPGASLGRPINDAAGGYVVSPSGGGVRILSGVELGRPADPPDLRQLEAVVADAGRTLPLGPRDAAPVWHGSRPSTPDGMPVIGRPGGEGSIVCAFGHGHIGLSTGPVTGLIVARLIAGDPEPIPISPFSPDRFRRARAGR